MFSSKAYRSLIFLGVLLFSTASSLSAMSCSVHKAEPAELIRIACCQVSPRQSILSCPISDLMVSGTACSCQLTPASEISHHAVFSTPVPVWKVAVRESLFQQNPEPPAPAGATGDPPELHPAVPVFLRLCTLLN